MTNCHPNVLVTTLVLIIIRKSHTGFLLVLTLVTLNDLAWSVSPYFALFHQIQ